MLTEHLLNLGCRRILFVSAARAAATVDAREAGYREALYAHGVGLAASWAAWAHRVNPDDLDAVRELMRALRPEAIVCANDRTAGRLMHTLRRLEHRVPHDVRLVGVDDVEYARLLPLPLTTLRQPTRQIGDAALAMMLDRIARRTLPPRELHLDCELTVRDSCGAKLARAA